MKKYLVNKETLDILKENFGMEFFHRNEGNKLIVKPINDYVFKRMCKLVGVNKFKIQ